MANPTRAAPTSVRASGDGASARHFDWGGPLPASAIAAPAAASSTAAAIALRIGSGGRARGLLERLLGVVARAHQRPRRDRLEAQRVGLALELGELVRVPVADDRQVVLRRAEVLPDGEDLDAVFAEDPERLDQLLLGLAQPGHEPGLGHDLVAAHLLGVLQYAARAQEPRAAAGQRIEARHGLDVVVEDVGPL